MIRGHWGVENSSHHIRDVTFAEDASNIYTGTAPRAMATFRTLAIGSLKALGADNIAETTRAIRQAGCIKADVVLQASECRACGEVAAMLDSLVLEGGGTVFCRQQDFTAAPYADHGRSLVLVDAPAARRCVRNRVGPGKTE
ncbi:UNVERIFIED_CONTAM: hypothetical protein RKD43_005317 [Streptomyces graminofaciens]